MLTTESLIIKLRKRHVDRALRLKKEHLATAGKLMKAVVGRHGKGAMRLLATEEEVDVPCFSTGRQEFDDWLTGTDDVQAGGWKKGTGKGLPKGRIIEIYGPESSGKTTLTLNWIAAAQASGGLAAFIDAEHAFDPMWARKQGVRVDELLLSQPDSGEDALQIATDLTNSKKVSLIVIDSVAALTPRKELEGDMGDSHMGLHARMMSQALRKLRGIAMKTNTTIIFINQIRMKIGVVFGNPETTPGGNALKFYSSMRIEIRKVNVFKKRVKIDLPSGGSTTKEKPYGAVSKLKMVKNKVASPFREIECLIEFRKGITQIADTLKQGKTNNE